MRYSDVKELCQNWIERESYQAQFSLSSRAGIVHYTFVALGSGDSLGLHESSSTASDVAFAEIYCLPVCGLR